MGDWQELGQSVVIGLIFSFLVAKLISMVMSFREDNLKIVRERDLASVESIGPVAEPEHITDELSTSRINEVREVVEEEEEGKENEEEKDEDERNKQKDVTLSESLLGEDEDDWEGVESTELDEAFSAACAFVAASAVDRSLSQKVSNDIQLQMYGFYKIATEGACNTPQPSALKMTARAKWNAWQKLGAMPPEEAMQKYVAIVTELYPSWATGSTSTSAKSKEGNGDKATSTAKGSMGPVFSSLVYEEETENELKLDAIHDAAREGEIDNVLKCIESGASVNLKDGEGRTPLHWAVDRGHLEVVEFLVRENADINAKDDEGQTPLHYAAMCDREAIAEFLVKQNADTDAKDNDGCSPSDLCESNWPWINQSSTKIA